MKPVSPRWDDRDVTRWWWNSNVYNDKGGEPMSEKKVTRAEVEKALEVELYGIAAPQYREEVLDRLFPKSEYEKAIEPFGNYPALRHVWNAAIEACNEDLKRFSVGHRFNRLKVPK